MIQVPMYRENGTRVQLADLLARIPANDWVWSILEFDGVGQMPANASIPEFRKRVREQSHGLTMTWVEVLSFAKALEYVIDCLVVAVSSVDLLDVDKLMADDFQQCEVAVRAIDSTEWFFAAASQALLADLEFAAKHS